MGGVKKKRCQLGLFRKAKLKTEAIVYCTTKKRDEMAAYWPDIGTNIKALVHRAFDRVLKEIPKPTNLVQRKRPFLSTSLSSWLDSDESDNEDKWEDDHRDEISSLVKDINNRSNINKKNSNSATFEYETTEFGEKKEEEEEEEEEDGDYEDDEDDDGTYNELEENHSMEIDRKEKKRNNTSPTSASIHSLSIEDEPEKVKPKRTYKKRTSPTSTSSSPLSRSLSTPYSIRSRSKSGEYNLRSSTGSINTSSPASSPKGKRSPVIGRRSSSSYESEERVYITEPFPGKCPADLIEAVQRSYSEYPTVRDRMLRNPQIFVVPPPLIPEKHMTKTNSHCLLICTECGFAALSKHFSEKHRRYNCKNAT